MHEWEDAFWLILGIFPMPVEMFEVDMTDFYSFFQLVLRKSQKEVVNKIGRSTCQNYDQKNDSYTGCFQKNLVKYFQSKKITCLPSYWESLKPFGNLEVCQGNKYNESTARGIIRSVRNGFKNFLANKADKYCPKDCKTISYNPKVTKFHIGYSLNHGNWTTLTFNAYFADDIVEHTKEYFIFNVGTFLSAIGGNVGLFLGYSVLSVSLWTLNIIFKQEIKISVIKSVNLQCHVAKR